MIHRHIIDAGWSLMAIESLFDRGRLADWREFAVALRDDPKLATATLRVCEGPVDRGSAALARFLVEHFHPEYCRIGG